VSATAATVQRSGQDSSSGSALRLPGARQQHQRFSAAAAGARRQQRCPSAGDLRRWPGNVSLPGVATGGRHARDLINDEPYTADARIRGWDQVGLCCGLAWCEVPVTGDIGGL